MYRPPSELYEQVAEILQEELSLDITKLKLQLVKLDSLRYEVAGTVAEWHQKLFNERERLRIPKEAGGTEFDRKTQLDATVSQITRDVEFLDSIDRIITAKINLGQVLLQTD